MVLINIKSKKASVALVFLIVSVLVVSSGAVLVHEIKKSNNENDIAGTGLVLLNTEQSNYESVLNSPEETDANIITLSSSSHISKSSKEDSLSSSGKDSSGSFKSYDSGNSDLSELIYSDSNNSSEDFNSSANNETNLNDTIINETNLSNEEFNTLDNRTDLENNSNSIDNSSNLNNSGSKGPGSCYAGSKETNEGPGGSWCTYGNYEECYDYFTKSTVIAYDYSIPLGYYEKERRTDYCVDFYTLNEAYLDCHILLAGSDVVKWKEKKCGDYNEYGDWVYYCTSNQVRKKRVFYDYGCPVSPGGYFNEGACKLMSNNWEDSYV